MNKSPILTSIIDNIETKDARHAKKLNQRLSDLEPEFYQRAEDFFQTYKHVLEKDGKTLEDGIDNYLRMINDYVFQQIRFMQTGEYTCKSFQEAYEQVYSKPEVMEYYMSGLIMSQFLWKHHYDIFTFFTNNLKEQAGSLKSYLEVGGGHGIHLMEAMEILGEQIRYDLIDISESSIRIAKQFLPVDRVNFFLNDIYEFPVKEKYDFITMGEVLEHVEKPVELLQKLGDLLNENGTVFITVPGNAPAIDHIYLFHNKEHLINTIETAGLKVTHDILVYSEDIDHEKAEKLKVPFMYAAFLKKNLTMEQSTILTDITAIFRDVLENDDITLSNETTANDIEEWDSLTHIQLIVGIEKKFNIRFNSMEVGGFKQVGDMVRAIAGKL